MAQVVVKADAREATRRTAHARAGMGTETRGSARLVAEGGVQLFRAQAPRRTGRLRGGIRVIGGGASYTVRVDAHDPGSGFNYVPVTRVGHSVAIIRPKRAKALKIQVGGGVIFRKSSRGYHPSSDWAKRAHPAIRRLAKGVAVRLAGKIERLFR